MPTAYRGLIDSAANNYGVPAELVAAVISAESAFDPKARSSVGAGGLMQLMPQTAKGLGVKDVFDPTQNVNAGTKYLGQLLAKYGDPQLALAAYNMGPGALDKTIEKYGANWSVIRSHAPKETQSYVDKVMSKWG